MASSPKLMCYPSIRENEFDGFTLIMPAISIGNIGQLALDVLLASLKAQRVTSCHHPSIIPLVGSNPLNNKSTELTTACEIYQSEMCARIILMQIRSGTVRGKSNEFLDDLLLWCKNVGIKKVILLASSAADERVDSQIIGSPVRYLENGKDGTKAELQCLNWTEMERKQTFPGRQGDGQNVGSDDCLFIPGSGYTKKFFLKCSKSENATGDLSFVVLLMFASEGDNSGDAIRMVSYLNQWLKLLPVTEGNSFNCGLKLPDSWNGLFGNPAPKVIFG